MTFQFEKLLVYQKSVYFADTICTATEQFSRGFGFHVDQLNRAAVANQDSNGFDVLWVIVSIAVVQDIFHYLRNRACWLGRWLRRHPGRFNDVVFFKDVCEHLGIRGSCVSRILAQCVLSGKVKNLGHQKGWIAMS